MTPKQTQLYWREWAAVRSADPKADRHDLHTRALGRDKSSKDFTNRDLDQVLGVFRAISDPLNLAPQIRAQRQGRARLEHRLAEITQCLGVYVEDPAGYVARVVSDRWPAPTGGSIGPDDLSDKPSMRKNRSTGALEDGPSQLHQLVMTLWARLMALRRGRGHSLAEMYAAAGVPARRLWAGDGRTTSFSREARQKARKPAAGAGGRANAPVPAGEEPF